MWAAWVTGPATDDRRPARVPLDQPFPGKRRVRVCLKRGAWQIVYKQGMRGDCSASEEGMSPLSTADAPPAPPPAGLPGDLPLARPGRALPAGVAQRAPARAVAGRAPLVSPAWRLVCVLDVSAKRASYSQVTWLAAEEDPHRKGIADMRRAEQMTGRRPASGLRRNIPFFCPAGERPHLLLSRRQSLIDLSLSER